MKKIISIHLANKVFQMEEDAYSYLDSVLNGQWKKQELEAQVAERFEAKLNANKTVITYPDVVEVLYNLGFSVSANSSASDTLRNKKLYRQMKNKTLGGVCTGLSEFFEIDPVIIRVLFVVAFFFGSIGFWLYLILWIVVPKAPLNP